MTIIWKETLLGEILTERKEMPTSESLENGEVSIVSKIGFKQGKIELRSDGKTKTGMILIHPGDLVVSGINAAKGAIAIYDEKHDKPIAATIHYGSYIPNKERVEIKYLWWFLRSAAFRDIVQHYVPGGIKTELKSQRLLSVPIPLPPLDEQRIILEQVEALAACIAKTQSLREEADKEVDIFLKSYLSNIFDYEHGDKLPKDWEWKSFDQTLAHKGMRTGPFGTALNKSEIYSEGVPVFGIPNVGNNKFRSGFTDYITTEKAKLLSSYVLEEGDIAVARSGTVGRSCVVPKGLNPKPIMSSNLIRIRIDKNVFLPELMCQILNGSKLVKRHIDKECRGSTRIFFTQKILNKFQIPTPPLDEQRRIVAYLDSVQARLESLRELQSATGEELSALLPSVLDRAFKGEL